jgi:predicted transcriptional regulator
VSLEILTTRLIEMSRSKESNAILMSHLYKCMKNQKFSKNLVELLKDLKAIEEIGEEETIFLKTKLAWHIKEISNYAENLPKIISYPSPPEFSIYKIFVN